MSMTEAAAITFLTSLLNKTLAIQIMDGRIFVGAFKCTDNQSNIILDDAFEYRPTTEEVVKSSDPMYPTKWGLPGRFVGRVIVPGEHIYTIEVEEEDEEEEGSGEEEEEEGEGNGEEEGTADAVLIETVVETTSEPA